MSPSPSGRIDVPASFSEEAADIMVRGYTNSVVAGFRLDPWEIELAWSTGYGQNTLPDGQPDPKARTTQEYKTECLARLLELEDTHGGGSEMLRRLNGIRNFGRTAMDTLHHLCDDRHRTAARAILFAVAVDCHNGGLLRPYLLYDKLRQRAPDDTAFVLTEIGSMDDFGLAADRLHDHGKDTKAHVVGVHGHGRTTGMRLRFFWLRARRKLLGF